jgi:hypothetical protein
MNRVSVSKSRKRYGIPLADQWYPKRRSRTRQQISQNQKGEASISTYRDFGFTLSTPELLLRKALRVFRPSLTSCSIVRRGYPTTPLGCAASIRTILSAGIPETLAASEATLNTEEWTKSRLAFVVFN